MHVTELFVTLLLHRVLRLVCLHFARRPFLLNITQQAMNKYYRKVLEALKTNRDIKALGFSRKELKGVAANVANKLQLKDDATDEEVSEGISDAIDDVLPLLQLTQSAADRQVSEYKTLILHPMMTMIQMTIQMMMTIQHVEVRHRRARRARRIAMMMTPLPSPQSRNLLKRLLHSKVM